MSDLLEEILLSEGILEGSPLCSWCVVEEATWLWVHPNMDAEQAVSHLNCAICMACNATAINSCKASWPNSGIVCQTCNVDIINPHSITFHKI